MSAIDRPKILGDPVQCQARLARLREPHMEPLSTFVENLRKEIGSDFAVPNFDPCDGGIAAEILYLLEAPGAKAISSGFVSRNNPDETAKNFYEMNIETNIPRERTITWNIVPWYIGSGTKIRAANSKDIEAGIDPLRRLLGLLPKVRAVVLIGRKAARAEEDVLRLRPNVKVFISPHPSPLYVNNMPGNRDKILDVLREVSNFL